VVILGKCRIKSLLQPICCLSKILSVNITERSATSGFRESVFVNVDPDVMSLRADVTGMLASGSMVDETVWTFGGHGPNANTIFVQENANGQFFSYPYTFQAPMLCLNASWIEVETININSNNADIWVLESAMIAYGMNSNDCSPVIQLQPYNELWNSTETVFYNYETSTPSGVFNPCTPGANGDKVPAHHFEVLSNVRRHLRIF